MSANQPSINDYDMAARYVVASFIAWQVAVANHAEADVGLKIADEAEENIEALSLGKEILFDDTPISLTNDIGRKLAVLLSESIDNLANSMERALYDAAV